MEAMRVTEELRMQVAEKLERVRAFLETLDEKAGKLSSLSGTDR